ncbi:16S rRNA pseudouridine(516) synthase [Methylibium sp.]|uniref:16S rRNA pseudouridine(516) synthase n=1 Tax=Methylibium sp. TaxID=2067992 RepID=UPI00286C36AC|nr:16S rRNA pseudouridine(516) synthase [Methylibium sp.]
MRWSQLLFTQGFGTRRACDALVHAGLVRHAGRAIDDPGETIDPVEGLPFEVEGRAWPYHERALILMHKPPGYECSQRPGASPSVMTLLPGPLRLRGKGGVQAVGRLDVDTTGVLLLTDDGPLLHRLTSPKHHVPKVYEVTAKHPVSDEQIEQLRKGVVLDDDPAPVRAAAAERTGEQALRLTLTEGKYHQVKRMLAAVGNRCEALHRSAIGALVLHDELRPGQWRWVSDEEHARLTGRGADSSA